MDIKASYYETLYQRSVVQLSGYSAKYALPQSLYAYLAFGGPTASMKDALAEGMLAIATEKGLRMVDSFLEAMKKGNMLSD